MNISATQYKIRDKILMAAESLDQLKRSPFTTEALVVEAWQQFPETFGMRGYSTIYPNSNKVISNIAGKTGMVARGMLVKVAPNLFALRPPENGLDAANTSVLMSLRASIVAQKFGMGKKADASFADACTFWDLREAMTAEQIDERIEAMAGTLAGLARLLDGDDVSPGVARSAGEVRALANIHRYLESRFERQLNMMRDLRAVTQHQVEVEA